MIVLAILTNGKYRVNTLLLKPNNEEEFAIQDYHGLHFLDLKISSPQTQTTFISNSGIDGQQQQGPILYGARTATANFYLEVIDEVDFETKCHELYNKFFHRQLTRVRQTNDIARCFYGIAKPFDITHISYLDKTFSVEFDIPSAYLYSVIRSSDFPVDIKKNPYVLSNNLNLPFEDLNYTQHEGSFKIFNPSDFDIQPYEQNHELNIRLKGNGNPTLINKDTGYSFSYNKQLIESDTLILKGVHPFLNGNPCEIDTNHGSIILQKGWNNFSLTGFTGTASFDFPFIYL
ncbi:hypothetical protein CBP76_07105 [Companilactobacillus nuruki]|uniref:Siphovirus-type tail component RIFT-related domain-containing protein n=1 Tax=Companilactobacillus nuruki TaxID=1993540 RepID=A0A2N7ATY0_9LACO|nr:hypothetical protein CBP76_07105 [Companilactobacillus nuruki]